MFSIIVYCSRELSVFTLPDVYFCFMACFLFNCPPLMLLILKDTNYSFWIFYIKPMLSKYTCLKTSFATISFKTKNQTIEISGF